MKPLAPERVALLKAADLIEREGWCQFHGQLGGSRCVIGAVNAIADNDSYFTALWLFREFLGETVPAIPLWNDAPGRTQAEVVSALRSAAVHGL